MIAALVDVGSPQEFVAALPAATVIENADGLYHASYSTDGGNAYQLFAKKMFSNQSRWVACMVGDERVFQWMASRLDNVRVKRITKELYLANVAAFNAIGFSPIVRDGVAFIKLPHVISGQSPWIEVQQ